MPAQLPVLLTVRQFADRHPAFTEASLRLHIFNAQDRKSTQGIVGGNGLARALVRVGRRVLIDESEFFAWVREQQPTDA